MVHVCSHLQAGGRVWHLKAGSAAASGALCSLTGTRSRHVGWANDICQGEYKRNFKVNRRWLGEQVCLSAVLSLSICVCGELRLFNPSQRDTMSLSDLELWSTYWDCVSRPYTVLICSFTAALYYLWGRKCQVSQWRTWTWNCNLNEFFCICIHVCVKIVHSINSTTWNKY